MMLSALGDFSGSALFNACGGGTGSAHECLHVKRLTVICTPKLTSTVWVGPQRIADSHDFVAARELIVVGAFNDTSCDIVDSIHEMSVRPRDRTNSRLPIALAERMDTARFF